MTTRDILDNAVGKRVLGDFLSDAEIPSEYRSLTVQATIEEARAHLRYGSLNRGMTILEALLGDDDTTHSDQSLLGVTLSVRGQSLQAWGNADQASQFYGRAVDAFRSEFGDSITIPDDWPMRWRADLALALAGAGEGPRAHEILDAATCSVCPTPEAARHLALSALNDNDLDRASALVFEALATLPADGEAWFITGEILSRRNDSDARLVFRHAARLWMARDAFGHSVRALRMLTADSPNNSELEVVLAWACAESGDIPQASAAVDRAITANPTAVKPLLVRAVIRHRLALEQESLADARAVTEQGPDDPVTHAVLSRALLTNGLFEEAIAAAQRALELSDSFTPARICLAQALIASGRPEDAITRLDDAFRKSPADVDLAAAYAEASHKLGRFSDVIDALLQFSNTDELSPRATFLLVDALTRSDYVDDALDIARYAAQQFDDDDLARATGSALARQALLRDVTDMHGVLKESKSLAPNDPNVLVLEASISLHDRSLAEDLLRTALRRDPSHIPALPMLVDKLLGDSDQDSWREAEAFARKALAIDHVNPDFRASLARALDKTGRHTEALLLLDSDPELEPESLGRWRRLRADIAQRTGNWELALADRRAVVEQAPNDIEALLDLADAALGAGDWEQAASAAQMTLEVEPDNVGARGILGATLAQLGERDAALLELDTALALNPMHPFTVVHRARIADTLPDALKFLARLGDSAEMAVVARTERGFAYQRFGNTSAAVLEYEAILADDPHEVSALINLAWCEAVEGLLPSAVEHAKKATSLAPNDADALATLGDVQRLAGSVDESILSLERARSLAPQSPYVAGSLARTLSITERVDDAIEVTHDVVVKQPESPSAWRILGDHILNLGYFDESIAALRRSLELDEADGWTRQQLGWALAHADTPDIDGALAEFHRARLSGRDEPWLVKDIANMKHVLGHPDAEERYQEALDLAKQQFGSDPQAGSLMGWCHFRLGNFNRAARLFFAAISAAPDPEPTRFDLALATLCVGHAEEASQHFDIAAAQVARRHPLRRRAPLRIAEEDLKYACRDWPEIESLSETQAMMAHLRAEITKLPPYPTLADGRTLAQLAQHRH